jgi:transposase InsO family protein
MQRINIDTIGPLRADSKGNVYILAIIDNFSRFLMLYPIPDTTAGEYAARILLAFVATFGCPNQITSDQGRQFVNQTVKELITLIGSEHVTSIAYSHEENAIIERSHKETMRQLRAIMFDRQLANHWSDCLPLVQRLHNAKVHDSTGFTPARIIFGDAISLDDNILIPHENHE